MEDLHVLLTWTTEKLLRQQCQFLRAQHQGAIAISIGRALHEAEQTSSSYAQATNVLSRMSSLPSDTLYRIIEAPETSFQIAKCRRDGATTSLLNFMAAMIAAEDLRSGKPQQSPYSVWTSMGDCYFPVGSPVQTDNSTNQNGWLDNEAVPFFAPVQHGITIDFVSPYVARPLEQNNFRAEFAKPIPFNASQVALVLKKVQEAFENLESVSGCPFQFVEYMLRVVMPRQELSVNQFSGSSNRLFLGRANLFNPHLNYINAANIVNSLIHESIHTLLYLIEQRAMPVEDTNVLYYDLVESPWSGRKIHLLAYIHASFVWYGLFHFWCLPGVEKNMSGAVRDHYLEFTRKGFRNSLMIDRIKRFEKQIRPALMEQLKNVQSTMLRI